MVAALAAPLAERGVRIGVLAGTGICLRRKRSRRAIQAAFQDEAIRCTHTVCSSPASDTPPGAPTVPSDNRSPLKSSGSYREGRSKDEIREALEGLNLGRLRIAAKGVARKDQPAAGRPFTSRSTKPLSVRRHVHDRPGGRFARSCLHHRRTPSGYRFRGESPEITDRRRPGDCCRRTLAPRAFPPMWPSSASPACCPAQRDLGQFRATS